MRGAAGGRDIDDEEEEIVHIGPPGYAPPPSVHNPLLGRPPSL